MAARAALLFIEGALAFVSPCMLPLLPVYMTYLAAESGRGRRTCVVNTIFFVAGFTVVFMALGATATSVGAALGEHKKTLAKASGMVIALFGLHFLGFLNIPFLDAKKELSVKNKRKGAFGAFIFGAAFSLCWTPCLGPLLASALMQASNGETLLEGAFSLFAFSMGLGVPYILTALFITKIKKIYIFLKGHAQTTKRASGALLLTAGVAMALGWFDYWAGLFG